MEIRQDASAFDAIHTPGCSAAIWQRELSQDLTRWVDALDLNHLPNDQAIVPTQDIHEALTDFCAGPIAIDPVRTSILIEDATKLAEGFAASMGAAFVGLKLNVVKTNSCRKFHKDWIKARLVCTYRGTGTQYGISIDKNDPATIETVTSGSPIVLRGCLWPETPDSGVLHRSPPIAGTGETRLLFVVDVADAPQDDL